MRVEITDPFETDPSGYYSISVYGDSGSLDIECNVDPEVVQELAEGLTDPSELREIADIMDGLDPGTAETLEVYVSECCGSAFVPGTGPDNIVGRPHRDGVDAEREGECPACGHNWPGMTRARGGDL